MTSTHPDTPSVGPGAGASDCHERLAEQLHTLTQVVETITYRLLELEERLTLQESQLQELHQQVGGSLRLSDGAEQCFDDTEERLLHLESLLNGMEPAPSAAASRHLQSVKGSQGRQIDSDPPSPIDGPFLEEPEQAFMDDLQGHDPQLDLEDLEDLTA
jgi:hypothetical protein